MEERVVICAEKSQALSKKVTSLLKKHGFHVETAQDGPEVLHKALSLAPDLVVVGESLPQMNGYDLCTFLGHDPATRDLPVVLLSSREAPPSPVAGGSLQVISSSRMDELGKLLKSLARRKKKKTEMALSDTTPHLLKHSLSLVSSLSQQQRTFSRLRDIALTSPALDQALVKGFQVVSEALDIDAGLLIFPYNGKNIMLLRFPKPASEDYVNRLKMTIFDSLAKRNFSRESADFTEKTIITEGEHQLTGKDIHTFWNEPVTIEGKQKGFVGLAVHGTKAKTALDERSGFAKALMEELYYLIENAYVREECAKLTTTDALTGVLNRHRIIEVLKKEHVRAKRYFLDLSLILVDIDNFKTVNDFYGYQVGDVILKDLSKAFIETMRSIDEVGRYGGEEFLIILPETNLKEGGIAANRIKNRVTDHVFPGIAKDIKVSLSMGITTYLRDIDISVDDILRRADQSLGEAKKRGKNCLYVMSK
ncbi:MAG: diguanylate cyclase [Candidatus Eremiobacteraeota bacterium]|nr:diguanylate cyclase [Candidatus Eremiobacteraeota bacterium]